MNDVKGGLEATAEHLLRALGVHAGQYILDFGCGSGNYALPAARIVGRRGRVYVLDKDTRQLDALERKARSLRLSNVVRLETRGELDIPLEDGSVDVVLLYDIIHPYYFPRSEDRKKLASEARRVLKAGGLLSIYPTHLGTYAGVTLEELNEEVEQSGLSFAGARVELLVHDRSIQRGTVLNYGKAR
jgi:ubiquinone/menaquinone biosynthesis C-methylase UbiE